MSQILTDSENVISSLATAPDKLRAEIGSHYSMDEESGRLVEKNFSSMKIQSVDIGFPIANNQTIIPSSTQEIKIEGIQEVFRDQNQWKEFISETIVLNRNFLDHSFFLEVPTVTNSFLKNYHMPSYENASKESATNLLLNYNLISYPHSNDTVSKIGQIRTSFDLVEPSLESIMNDYNNRLLNYTGSIVEIQDKQRNIFIFNIERNNINKTDFPYFYKKDLLSNQSNSQRFKEVLDEYNMTKNIFQSIKNNVTFENRGFNLGVESIDGKIFDINQLLLNRGLISFEESFDEIFLLKKEELIEFPLRDRFVNNVRSIRFLREMRNEIKSTNRKLEDIFEGSTCNSFLLGYKIEKYIDNDNTRPIQTFYTDKNELVDTQLKYGRKYIYKTKALIGIFGSSYSYSDLQISESSYQASAKVEIRPSIQILEIDIDIDEVAFVDTPMFYPHVSFYGDKAKPVVNFLLQPRNFNIHDFGAFDGPTIGNLLEQDQIINDLYSLSKSKKISHEYFTGIYEVFRMERPPKFIEEFSESFLLSVDETLEAGNLGPRSIAIENFDTDVARFSDNIIPNKKYYYAFRSITFHGTPSELSPIIEVELQKDSDEYRIVSKEYRIESVKNYSNKKMAKRLMRIVPNIDRLVFTNENSKDSWDLDDGNLVTNQSSDAKTFKIRVTSKHTGKKIDLNVTFKINRDGSFFSIVGPN